MLRQSSRSMCSLLVLVAGSLSAAAADREITAGLSFWSPDSQADYDHLSYVGFIKLINQNLKDAQQANLFIDACYSGPLHDLVAQDKTKFAMPYVLGTATQDLRKTTDMWSSRDVNPPGRPRGEDDGYYGGYTPYLAKHLAGPAPTVRALLDSAGADNAADPDRKYGEVPKKSKGAGGDDTLKINQGTNKKHAGVFAANLSKLYTEPPNMLARRVTALNYDSVKYYKHNRTAGDYTGYRIDGNGSFGNFKSWLEGLEPTLRGDKGKQTVSLFIETHGIKDTKNSKFKVGAIPGTPKQGEAYAGLPGGSDTVLTLTMDDEYWSDLREEVTADLPDQVRALQPRFYLAYSEAAMAADSFMDIAIGDIFLGSYHLDTTSLGGLLEVTLTDSILAQVLARHDGAPELALTFGLNEGDMFRIAVDDDILTDPLFQPLNYGTGLLVSVQGTVPAPGGATVLMTSLAFAARRRRRGCS